jgi:hypothetical protein
MNVKSVSQPMDIATTLLLVALFILAALILFPRNVKRARFIRLVDKLPGPPSWLFVGSELPVMLAPRNSESNHYFSTFFATNGISGQVQLNISHASHRSVHCTGLVAFHTERCSFL